MHIVGGFIWYSSSLGECVGAKTTRCIQTLKAQTTVEFEAASGKELVLENESDRLSDLGRFAQTP
jgi:hypothetical protein